MLALANTLRVWGLQCNRRRYRVPPVSWCVAHSSMTGGFIARHYVCGCLAWCPVLHSVFQIDRLAVMRIRSLKHHVFVPDQPAVVPAVHGGVPPVSVRVCGTAVRLQLPCMMCMFPISMCWWCMGQSGSASQHRIQPMSMPVWERPPSVCVRSMSMGCHMRRHAKSVYVCDLVYVCSNCRQACAALDCRGVRPRTGAFLRLEWLARTEQLAAPRSSWGVCPLCRSACARVLRRRRLQCLVSAIG
jgi:hypothetical protein